MDESGNLITLLNDKHYQDGNFVWTYQLPNSLFADDAQSITLYVRLNANLKLTEGDGLRVRNTMERMIDISICGALLGGIE